MMTIHKLSAGDGYLYYTRETVTGDVRRTAGRELGDYYTGEGNPPGVWVGNGIEELRISGTVTEAQMAALYGEGLHPNADEMLRTALSRGASLAEATRKVRLGRRYYQYDQTSGPLASKIEDSVEEYESRHGRAATTEERKRIRAKAGAIAFREDFGRSPKSDEELNRYISANTASDRQACAGYDLVFRAAKSISVLWALGDEATRQAIEKAHEEAITDTLTWIEEHALATRTGINGIAQEDVLGGLVAARYRHYDSRLGDPLLHDHVVLANKVKGLDGRWRSIDGKLLYAFGVAASELYNQRVVEGVCANLNLQAEEREVTAGKRPVMEISGIETDMLEAHSKRGQDIKRVLQTLLEDYRRLHLREPGVAARMALIQQATLQTRPSKKTARSLADLRAEWREDAVALFGQDRVDSLLQVARAQVEGITDIEEVNIEEAAQDVLAVVSDQRSVWGERHMLAEARRYVVRRTKGRNAAPELAAQIAQHALTTGSLNITPPDLHRPFAPLLRHDGSSIYRRRESALYTSSEVLTAESRVVNAARMSVIPALAIDRFEEVVARFQGPSLDPGQRRLARSFACSDALLAVGIGPAGSGKTTALQLVRDAVNAGGGRLIPLAPSSRAAKVMEKDLGIMAHTLHGWLAQRDRLADGRRVKDAFMLRPGDVVVVDEAGMAGTKNLARVVAEAEAAGALIRLIGDPTQLGSVESGGALRLVARDVGAVELEELHRFKTEGEAEATLVLRDGDPVHAWQWHLDHGRVVGGERTEMLDAVFSAWQADTEAGLHTLMTADDSGSVLELNMRAQAFQIASGRLDLSMTTPLRDDLLAAVGDLIVTRKNQRKLLLLGGRDFVKNGDQWRIEHCDNRGNVTARHTGHGGRVVLSPQYLRRHGELGYASSIHRAQGITVDTSHGLITPRTSREAAYVEATRGRTSNSLYVVAEEGQTMRDVLDTVVRSSQASISAHEAIETEQERAYDISRLASEYTDVHSRALSHRLKSLARRILGPAAETFIGADAWDAVERSIRSAESEGWDAEELLAAAHGERGFADADDPAAVLVWRIDNRVDDGRRAAARAAARENEPGHSRPLKYLSREQLQRLLDLAEQHRRIALDELNRADAAVANQPRVVIVSGLPYPAWPRREHGPLTGADLASAIFEARGLMRRAEREGDHHAKREAAAGHSRLQQEQWLRRAMPQRDRQREDWQREPRSGASRTAFQPLDETRQELTSNFHRQESALDRFKRAEVIAARIRAEQRLRHQLPQGSAPTPNNAGSLPDWLAPSAAVRDADTPEGWRQHLVERRMVLAQRLQEIGMVLADAPPSWVRVLGPVPLSNTDLREVWERTAALAAAWRLRHGLADDVFGIGEQPAEELDAHAWAIVQQRIEEVGRRARASAAARHRPEDPSGGMRIAARTAENFQMRLLDFYLAQPGDRAAVAAAAATFADLALGLALEGGEAAEDWVEHIPPPDAEDMEQQAQWARLVAALAAYRMLNQVDSDEPLGETPEEQEAREKWTELNEAMTLFQRSRIQQRLREVHSLRDADRSMRGLSSPTPSMTDGTIGSRRATSTQDEQQHHQRRSGPHPGAPRRPGQ